MKIKTLLSHATILASVIILFSMGCSASREYSVENIDNEKLSGTIELQLSELALGIGGTKGSGVLTYDGEEYPFTTKGVDYGSFSKVKFKSYGNVFHLDELENFEGLYFRAKAGLTVGSSGGAGMWLVNSKGVTIHVTTEEEKGFDLTLGRGGIKISFDDEAEVKLD